MQSTTLQKLRTGLKNRKLNDWLLLILILFVLVNRLPAFIEQNSLQGTKLNPVMLDGKLFPIPNKKSVLVFWATWCGPCTIELKRIQSAIDSKEISSNNIFAVNMGENPELVNRAIHDRKYSMPVVFDKFGELAQTLRVKGTPTIALIDETGKIDWISSGLSPSLIYRIKYFLKE